MRLFLLLVMVISLGGCETRSAEAQQLDRDIAATERKIQKLHADIDRTADRVHRLNGRPRRRDAGVDN